MHRSIPNNSYKGTYIEHVLPYAANFMENEQLDEIACGSLKIYYVNIQAMNDPTLLFAWVSLIVYGHYGADGRDLAAAVIQRKMDPCISKFHHLEGPFVAWKRCPTYFHLHLRVVGNRAFRS